MSSWPRITDLIVDGRADVAILGAPMAEGSVTPASYDQAPGVIRAALSRFSTYDLETRGELTLAIADAGDVPLAGMMPAVGFEPVRDAVARCTSQHGLTLVLGGHNGVTRPAAHGLGLPLDKVGLITLDAHFDLRDTDEGPRNGNPVRCLLEDGLPGRNVCQIGLVPFANSPKMHATADEEGIGVYTIADVKRRGVVSVLDEALARISQVEAIMIDFDIDVIERSQCPGAPGARPGGMPVDMFFGAARYLARQPKVKLVDLTEFDPGLDVSDITALTAARWVCEILAGYSARSRAASA
ncbi:MAG TPA: arginase family protein [Allosphingosinicella sp.]|nr:arginase family protein [Allosphingosinicella sp.]